MQLLWVKAGKLLPVDTGGKIRSYNILRHLALGHDVTFLSYYDGPHDDRYEEEIESQFPRACTINTGAVAGRGLTQVWSYLRRLLQPAPFAVAKFTHQNVQRVVASWLREKRFDICICDFLAASLNFPGVLSTPTVLFQHNVETSLWQRRASTDQNLAKRLAYKIEAAKMLRFESRALAKFDHIVAVSEHDRRQFLEMEPTCNVSVVPTGVDTQKYAIVSSVDTSVPRIVFTGSMDWEPNIDAVIYFCRDIFPRIRAEFPNTIFQVVGRDPHPRVRQLASESIQVTGTVPSVKKYLHDATVVVVPLRAGGGTRLKIFEAMAMGRAVVSTSIGAEGLDVTSGSDVVLADNAGAFADAVILLLRNPIRRRQYEQAAATLAAQHDWSKIADRFAAVLQTVESKGVSKNNLRGSFPLDTHQQIPS
jgi:polysaccharide biosynthesis protein PslH